MGNNCVLNAEQSERSSIKSFGENERATTRKTGQQIKIQLICASGKENEHVSNVSEINTDQLCCCERMSPK